ncbi:MAG: hypothetical protein IMZ50_09955 [Candidatus Atribacteria bacterium]|nr:hypothetical protein [Candidatus Atribacteria bacterium]
MPDQPIGLARMETPILFELLESSRRTWRLWSQFILIATLAMTAACLFSWAIGVAVAWLVVVACLVPMLYYLYRNGYYRREARQRWEAVPWQIQWRALRIYDTDWMQAAIECHECHLPGDCPICGAE